MANVIGLLIIMTALGYSLARKTSVCGGVCGFMRELISPNFA